MLSDSQRSEFEETGVVHLESAIAAGDIEAMRDRLWQELATRHGMQPDAPETWRCFRPSGFQKISRSGAFDATHCRAVREAASEILGRYDTMPFAQPLVNFPAEETEWTVPHDLWHLDLPATSLDLVPGLRAFTFLDEVLPRGGGTAVVAGSHRLVQRVVEQAAETTRLSSRRVRETLKRREPWIRDLFTPGPASVRIDKFLDQETVVDGIPLRVVELVGSPGDMTLMDLRTLHAPTPNARSQPRLVLGQVLFRSH